MAIKNDRRNYCVTCAPYESQRTLPANYSQKDANVFSHEISKTIPGSHARVERSANIVDDHLFRLFGIDSLSHYSRSSTSGRKDKIWQYLKNFQVLRPPKIIMRGMWVTDDWSAGYFHWFTDALTRVELVNSYWDKYPVLLPNHYKSIGYIETSLKILGVPYIYIDKSGRSLIQDLLLTSYTAETGNYNNELLNRLAGRFRKWASEVPLAATEKKEKGRRIFVSRALASRRKLTNEYELIPIFKEHDFEIVYSENISFEAQVKLYSTTTVLAGLHGAGLTNMLFTPSNSTVIEIRRKSDLNNNCYFTMASDLNHKYYYLMASSNTDDFNAGDCHLDPADVRLLLSSLPA